MPELNSEEWLAVGVALSCGELGTFPAGEVWETVDDRSKSQVDSRRPLTVSRVLGLLGVGLGLCLNYKGCSLVEECARLQAQLGELNQLLEQDHDLQVHSDREAAVVR